MRADVCGMHVHEVIMRCAVRSRSEQAAADVRNESREEPSVAHKIRTLVMLVELPAVPIAAAAAAALYTCIKEAAAVRCSIHLFSCHGACDYQL